MGLKMLDALSFAPVVAVGFAYWLCKRLDAKDAQLPSPLTGMKPSTTGDKELDVIFGLAPPLPVVQTTTSS